MYIGVYSKEDENIVIIVLWGYTLYLKILTPADLRMMLRGQAMCMLMLSPVMEGRGTLDPSSAL